MLGIDVKNVGINQFHITIPQNPETAKTIKSNIVERITIINMLLSFCVIIPTFFSTQAELAYITRSFCSGSNLCQSKGNAKSHAKGLFGINEFQCITSNQRKLLSFSIIKCVQWRYSYVGISISPISAIPSGQSHLLPISSNK